MPKRNLTEGPQRFKEGKDALVIRTFKVTVLRPFRATVLPFYEVSQNIILANGIASI